MDQTLQEILEDYERQTNPDRFGIETLNPLAFQFQNATNLYSPAQMDALKTMRLPGEDFITTSTYRDPSLTDPAFFDRYITGYRDYNPYVGNAERFNYLYGERPGFKYDTEFTGTTTPQQNFQFQTSAYEDDEEGDVEALTQKPKGIARLFELISNFSPLGFARRGLESLRGLNQRIQQSDFGRSKTGEEFFERRRLRKVGEQLQEASERGGGYQPTSQEQNVARTESRRSDKGVGQGGVYGL